MNSEMEKAWNGLMDAVDLLSIAVYQSELFTLKEACKYVESPYHKIVAERWKQPMCGFSSLLRSGTPLWTEPEILYWINVMRDGPETLPEYYETLLASPDRNISQGVLSELIALIVRNELPEDLRKVVDEFVRNRELIIA